MNGSSPVVWNAGYRVWLGASGFLVASCSTHPSPSPRPAPDKAVTAATAPRASVPIPPSTHGTSSADPAPVTSTTTTAHPAQPPSRDKPLLVQFRVSDLRRHYVENGRGHFTTAAISVHVHSEPAQRRVIGRLRQTGCVAATGAYEIAVGERHTVLFCHANGWGSAVDLRRISAQSVRIEATDGPEGGPGRSWSPGTLRLTEADLRRAEWELENPRLEPPPEEPRREVSFRTEKVGSTGSAIRVSLRITDLGSSKTSTHSLGVLRGQLGPAPRSKCTLLSGGGWDNPWLGVLDCPEGQVALMPSSERHADAILTETRLGAGGEVRTWRGPRLPLPYLEPARVRHEQRTQESTP